MPCANSFEGDDVREPGGGPDLLSAVADFGGPVGGVLVGARLGDDLGHGLGAGNDTVGERDARGGRGVGLRRAVRGLQPGLQAAEDRGGGVAVGEHLAGPVLAGLGRDDLGEHVEIAVGDGLLQFGAVAQKGFILGLQDGDDLQQGADGFRLAGGVGEAQGLPDLCQVHGLGLRVFDGLRVLIHVSLRASAVRADEPVLARSRESSIGRIRCGCGARTRARLIGVAGAVLGLNVGMTLTRPGVCAG